MLTVQNMHSAIGTTVQLRVDSLRVDCEVLDSKAVFGRIDLLVTPKSGSGQQWISSSRLVVPSK